jgi:hypothetical protein
MTPGDFAAAGYIRRALEDVPPRWRTFWGLAGMIAYASGTGRITDVYSFAMRWPRCVTTPRNP